MTKSHLKKVHDNNRKVMEGWKGLNLTFSLDFLYKKIQVNWNLNKVVTVGPNHRLQLILSPLDISWN